MLSLSPDVQSAARAQRRVAPPCPGSIALFVNFPSTIERGLVDDMIVNGIGANRFEFEIIVNVKDVIRHGAVVNLEMLPRSVGGMATSSFDEHAKLSAFLRGLL